MSKNNYKIFLVFHDQTIPRKIPWSKYLMNIFYTKTKEFNDDVRNPPMQLSASKNILVRAGPGRALKKLDWPQQIFPGGLG